MISLENMTEHIVAFLSICWCSYLQRKFSFIGEQKINLKIRYKKFFEDHLIFDEISLLDTMDLLYNIDVFLTFLLCFIFIYRFSPVTSVLSRFLVKDSVYVVMYFWREIEKEFFSADDVIFLLSTVMCAFGWFFFLSISTIFINISFFNFVITIIPVLIFITLLIPIFITYDIGLFFTNYLRGSSSTSLIAFEFMYDIIAIFIMYIRIIIQNLRFIFIFISCVELNEFIFDIIVNFNFILFNEEIFSITLYDYSWAPIFYNKYFIFKIPKYIIACVYYTGHVLFILFSNMISYLFLVFWLYLFLYTSFSSQKFEIYLKKLRY